jgi:hypothetical protein
VEARLKFGRAKASAENSDMQGCSMSGRGGGRWRAPAAVALGLLFLAGCGEPAAADRPSETAQPTTEAVAETPPAQIAGVYRMEGARVGRLTLAPVGDDWSIRLLGGVPTDMGAATPADCELRAEGPMAEGRIDGAVVPFEGDVNSITAQDLEGRSYRVEVHVAGGIARVSTDYDGCGMGADLNGEYQRAAGG